MDHHIIEDTAGNCNVGCRRGLRVTGGNDNDVRIADRAVLDCVCNCLVVVVEAAVEAYLELDALLLNECEQLLDLVDIIIDRLLAEYVLASLNCCHGYIAVRVSGGANEYYVYFRVVDNVHEVGGNVGDLALCQPLACAGLIQHRICCCDYLYARYRVDQVVDVQLADTAAANYADFQNAHCNSLLFSRSRLRMVSLHSADRIPQLSLG